MRTLKLIIHAPGHPESRFSPWTWEVIEDCALGRIVAHGHTHTDEAAKRLGGEALASIKRRMEEEEQRYENRR